MTPIVKIAVSGTHGVGKTTFVNALQKALSVPEPQVVKEWASKVFEMGKKDPSLKINQEANLEGQLWILGKQLEEEIMIESTLTKGDTGLEPEILLCDRSFYDSIIYTDLLIWKQPRYGWALNSLVDHLAAWGQDSVMPYDIIFYMPIMFELQGTEIRPDDRKFQKDIDKLMYAFLIEGKTATNLRLPDSTSVFVLDRGHIKENLEFALQKIQAFLQFKYGTQHTVLLESTL